MAWKKVCAVSAIQENALLKVNVDGISLVVANYGSGFRAFPPICPHMEEPLDESGILADCVLTCTKHLWAWDLRTDKMLGETEKPLRFYDVKVDRGDLYALIDHEIIYDFDGGEEESDDFFS
jgi:nitrite reductase/ring-hydroxylating ferredoxin subunit